MSIRKVESIVELRQLCMKYDPNGRPSIERWNKGAMRFFYPIQIYLTKILLTLGFTSLDTTLLWCAIGVIAAGFLSFGSFMFAFPACLLLYLQVALDGCDGEIARYNKRFLTPEKDFQFFARGVYLDECCHTIINPARLMGLSFGIYVQAQRIEFIICGIIMAYLVLFRMTTSFATAFTVNKLAHRLPKTLREADEETTSHQLKETIIERIISKAFQYYTNGKNLFMALTLFTLLDLICSIVTHGRYYIVARAAFVLIGPFVMLAGRRLEMVKRGGWEGLHTTMLEVHKKMGA